MRRRLRPLVAIGLLVVALLAGTAAAPVAAGASAGAEADFVARINDARAGRGLAPLQVDGELTGIGRRWSQRMADEQRLSHNPNLSREVSHDWEKLAENVGYGGDVATIHDAFMNSAAHRANILDGALTHIGVGVVVDGAGQLWVTEVFMRLRGGGAPAPATMAPPPPTTARPRPASPPPPPPTTAPPSSPPTTAAPQPEPEPEPAPAPDPNPTPAPDAGAAPASAPSVRLVLVLDRLVALDRGHGR